MGGRDHHPVGLGDGATALGQMNHQMGPAGADSGPLDWGMSWTRFFPTEGTFSYQCAMHPDPAGIITVKGSPISGGTAEIFIRNGTFEPTSLEIRPGTSVRWTNLDDQAHTVTEQSDAGFTILGLPWWQVVVTAAALAAGAALLVMRPRRGGKT
jgi:plastocyanin